MGVLDIRRSSVSLQNLPEIRKTNFENGAAEMWNAVGEVGKSIGKFGDVVGDIGVAIFEKDQKTRMNNFMAEVESETNKAMFGDGKDITGKMHEDFSDTKTWASGVEKLREEIIEKARKNHNIRDNEYNNFLKPSLHSFNETWNMRVAARAHQVSDKNAQIAAKARLDTITDSMKLGDSKEEGYVDWARAVNEDIDKSHIVDQGIASYKRKEAALKLIDEQYKTRLTLAAAAAARSEDPKEVANIFKEHFPDDNGKGFSFSQAEKNKLVQQALGGKMDEATRKIYEAKYNETLRAAEQRANYNKRNRKLREDAVMREGAAEKKSEFKALVGKIKDTEQLIDPKTLESQQDYNAKLDTMVEEKRLSVDDANELKDQYASLLAHREYMIKNIKANNGTWVTIKDRDGERRKVFQVWKKGGDKDTNFYREKYRVDNYPGKTSIWDDPIQAMDELEVDFMLGRITPAFYDAQMKYARVQLEPKAKAALMKVFGNNTTIFTEKDLKNPQIQVRNKVENVWAKNEKWNGKVNAEDGSDGTPAWILDAHKNGGVFSSEESESLVTDEQLGKIYEFTLEATEAGIDPTDAIKNMIAPTIKAWAQTSLDQRLDDKTLMGGRNFLTWMLEKGRVNEAGGRENRSPQARDTEIKENAKARIEAENN